MQIFVKDYSGKTITLDAERWDTIDGLKAKILAKEGGSEWSDDCYLTMNGHTLEGGRILNYYGIGEGNALQMAVRFRAGGGGGMGGAAEWTRAVRPRVGGPPVGLGAAAQILEQAGGAGAGPPADWMTVRSAVKIELMYQYSWSTHNGVFTWTCERCASEWDLFPIMAGHPKQVQELAIHHGSQLRFSRPFRCEMCSVDWQLIN